MGAPTSSVFSEIYLQNLENTVLYDILIKHKVIGYFRYVDDIIIIHKEEQTYIHCVSNLFKTATPSLSFNTKKEKENSIIFLDIAIYKTNNLSCQTYRKLTATDHIIPQDSNHPPEHKMSAINYLTNRIISYPLNETDKNQEYETIKYILHNKTYDTQILERLPNYRHNTIITPPYKKKKLVHLHLHRPTNKLYHKTFQKY